MHPQSIKNFLYSIVICLFVFQNNGLRSSHEDSISEELKKIPQEERVLLHRFFENLLANTSFGYTVFGDKPLTWITTISHPLSPELFFKHSPDFFTRVGWPVWQKYASLFPSKNFFLKIERSTRGSSLYVINKKALLNIIKENTHYFTHSLGDDATPDKIVEHFLYKEASLESIFDDDIVAGILFGYGLENALFFDRYMRVGRTLYNADTLLNPSLTTITPSAGFTNLEEEFNFIEEYFGGTPELFGDHDVETIFLVAFRTTNSPQNQPLLEKYRKLRKELAAIFASDTMLEVILKKFMEG